MASRLSSRGIAVAALIAVALMLLVLWRQQADMARLKDDNRRLSEYNRALARGAAAREAAPEGARTAPPARESAPEAAPRPESRPAEATPPPPPPRGPEPNPLSLRAVEGVPVPNGILATMNFEPGGTGSLGVVALVVRLPRLSDAKVLDLVPADSMEYADISKRVSSDGKFAIFQGTPRRVQSLAFGLTVSGAVTADVRGTCGIPPFKLGIEPAGARVLDR